MIDHMAVMRRQIEEMQEKALEGRSISKDLLAEVLVAVVESSDSSEERLCNNEVGAAEPGNASPDYEPPASPEYIPPQFDMETEVSQNPQTLSPSFKCSVCGFAVEGVIFELFEHLEEEHGMGDAEEELEKCCIAIGSKQDEVGTKDGDFDALKKSKEGLEAQVGTRVETENNQEDVRADTDMEERKADENEEEAGVNGQKDDDTKQKGDFNEEKQVDLKEEQVNAKKQEPDFKEQVVYQEEEKDIGPEKNKEEQDAAAKDDTIEENQEEDEDVDPAPSSSSSVASGVVTTIEELQVTSYLSMRSQLALLTSLERVRLQKYPIQTRNNEKFSQISMQSC